MKYLTNTFVLYLIIVILPVVFLIGYLSIQLYHKDTYERNQAAQRVAHIHEENWNYFIGQTVTILDILTISISTEQESTDKIEYLLEKGAQSDPRYAGMFVLNSNGLIMNGERSLLVNNEIEHDQFIQEAIQTKDIVISDQTEVLANGQHGIGIANPILDNKQNLTYILVVYFNSDYIINLMHTTFPNNHFLITNSKNETVLEVHPIEENRDPERYYSLSIDRIPWTLHVYIPRINHIELQGKLIPIALLILFSFHFLYFLLKYFIQLRTSKKEKKQNDLQKLELIGTFAASLAHEIRNPLTGIKGLIQLLSETHIGTKEQKYFSVIDQEINRINQIVGEFLILGKPSAVKTEILDARNIIFELVPLIEYEAKRNHHQLSLKVSDNPLYIKSSKDQMKQVILNITKNAIEAMNEKGSITISLHQITNEVHLSISDTGSGITPKQMKKIFHPFYTSKDSGTGLGLVICKRIIESFNGKIEIMSGKNEGTTVHIKLPLEQSIS